MRQDTVEWEDGAVCVLSFNHVSEFAAVKSVWIKQVKIESFVWTVVADFCDDVPRFS